MTEITLHVRVSGRVQGVWFRGWTQAEARALGLKGWVKNLPDGDVAACLSGPEPHVEKMIAALHRGPEAAIVRDVTWEPAPRFDGAGFGILR